MQVTLASTPTLFRRCPMAPPLKGPCQKHSQICESFRLSSTRGNKERGLILTDEVDVREEYLPNVTVIDIKI
eukprot:m.63772 g.63772  ORF g.63772 m.63772 type:complete len:72 (-) comp9682_c0_seq1:13-228(-)